MKALELLTQRERECLSLVDRHFSSKQIARELGMSKTSVDTYCDRARKKLGVTDRYTAARLLRDADLDPVLIESGQDTVRTDAQPGNWLGDPAAGGSSDGSATEFREQSCDRPGAAPASGNRRLRDPMASFGEAGRIAPGLLLVPTRTAAGGSLRDAGAGGHGATPGLGYPQACTLQAAGDGASGNSVHDLGSPGREFQGRSRGWFRRNELTPSVRLGAILGIAAISALAFGGMLVGLHALSDLARNLARA